MAVNATSFTSPLADKFASVSLPPQIDYVIEKVAGAGIVTWLVTLLAIAVAYDQSMSLRPSPPNAHAFKLNTALYYRQA